MHIQMKWVNGNLQSPSAAGQATCPVAQSRVTPKHSSRLPTCQLTTSNKRVPALRRQRARACPLRARGCSIPGLTLTLIARRPRALWVQFKVSTPYKQFINSSLVCLVCLRIRAPKSPLFINRLNCLQTVLFLFV